MPSVVPLGSDWAEKVAFKYSLAQEMLWSLHVLEDSAHHQDRLDWCLQVSKELPTELATDIEYLGKNFDQWGCFIQLVEALESDKIFTWHRVQTELTQIGQALFVYFSLNRMVKVGELIRYIRQPALIDQFLRNYPDLENGDMVRGLLSDPERIRTKLLKVLEQYWDLAFAREAEKLEKVFFSSLQEKIKLLQSEGLEQLLSSLGLGVSLLDGKLAGRAIIGDEESKFVLKLEEVDRILVLPTVFATPHLFPVFKDKKLILRYPLAYPSNPQQSLTHDEILAALKALADGTRLRILQLIAEKPRYSGELATELGFSEPTVSRHMKLLRSAGLVEVRKAENYAYYSLQPGILAELWPTLADYLRL